MKLEVNLGYNTLFIHLMHDHELEKLISKYVNLTRRSQNVEDKLSTYDFLRKKSKIDTLLQMLKNLDGPKIGSPLYEINKKIERLTLLFQEIDLRLANLETAIIEFSPQSIHGSVIKIAFLDILQSSERYEHDTTDDLVEVINACLDTEKKCKIHLTNVNIDRRPRHWKS
ncbi:hypothetical protein [Thioclava sp. GXIMD4215]|uniref:hypothetical protein n=1 Tax=Thioclava sp. GXIMD4215 TaxID=3131928 RepID=UPI0032526F1E